MGVQIPFSFPKCLDFKPFQTKVRVLPWQMNSTLIMCFNLHILLDFAKKFRISKGLSIFMFSYSLGVS